MSDDVKRWLRAANQRLQDQHRDTPVLRKEGGQVFFESTQERQERRQSEARPAPKPETV